MSFVFAPSDWYSRILLETNLVAFSFLSKTSLSQLHNLQSMDFEAATQPFTSADSDLMDQHMIDQQIVKLLENIRELKSKRNTLALISRLPSELLVRIFELVAEESWYSYRWIVFTQVSHYWRVVSFGAKALWCDIITDSKEGLHRQQAVDVFLKRSGSSLLDVEILERVSTSSGGISLNASSLLEQLSRIRRLSIDVKLSHHYSKQGRKSFSTVCSKLQNALAFPAHHLQEICLSDFGPPG
ncbi:hypothetical protein BDN72DRAFT_964855 [Pluteus cervinus]|uniref:Uncharacterized protein n=1 Tax=Pluteus cervinus TaxID=181527 RepID=A0ACD3A8D4_9AGAR|nr:hypothetical protein BDN72DRAFT_964855 [Pluteus cervinus]